VIDTPRVIRADFIKSAQSLKDSLDETISEVVFFFGAFKCGKEFNYKWANQ